MNEPVQSAPIDRLYMREVLGKRSRQVDTVPADDEPSGQSATRRRRRTRPPSEQVAARTSSLPDDYLVQLTVFRPRTRLSLAFQIVRRPIRSMALR